MRLGQSALLLSVACLSAALVAQGAVTAQSYVETSYTNGASGYGWPVGPAAADHALYAYDSAGLAGTDTSYQWVTDRYGATFYDRVVFTQAVAQALPGSLHASALARIEGKAYAHYGEYTEGIGPLSAHALASAQVSTADIKLTSLTGAPSVTTSLNLSLDRSLYRSTIMDASGDTYLY